MARPLWEDKGNRAGYAAGKRFAEQNKAALLVIKSLHIGLTRDLKTGLVKSLLAGALGALLFGGSALAQSEEPAFDPVRADPNVVDREFPPRSEDLTFAHEGEEMHGLVYYAQGKGPHPTLIMLHGFPGYEQNLDLAHTLRRAGFNVLTFHYRGTWGSDGTFSLVNARQDVLTAVRFLRTRQDPRIDAANIGLVGHSLGGFLALEAAAMDKFVGCTAAITPVNVGIMAKAAAEDPDYRQELLEDTGDYGPVRGHVGARLIAEFEAHPEFDLTGLGPELVPRPLLLIGATNDTTLPTTRFHDPLAVAYQALTWPALEVLLMDGDHTFSWNRMALADKVTGWALANCKSVQRSR